MLLYFAGSMIMYEPTEECIIDFWRNGILNRLPVASLNPNFIKAASQLKDSCEDKTLCTKMLREDYNRLFTLPDLALALAYESVYPVNRQLNSVQHISTVTEFYNSYGWESKFKGKISDDHLGIELLFLTILLEKYQVLDDEACSGEMRKEIRRFIDLHILSWIPEWNKKMQEHSGTLCYKGISTLIYACIEDIYALMENDPSMASHTDYLRN